MSGPGHEDTANHPSERGTVTRTLALTAIAVGAILVLILVAGAWVMMREARARHGSGSAVQVEIEPGSSSQAIARKLKSVGVIDNETTFRLRARIVGADNQLKPGVYDLGVGMTDASVLHALRTGPPVTYVSVTIPEGFVIDQIAERFGKQAGIPTGEFAALAKAGAAQFAGAHPYLTGAYKGSLEGYLFPKTYRVKEGSSAREVIELMLDQFDKEAARVDLDAAAANGLDLNQLVTLASMIERESRIDSERPLVSSVIHNRLMTDSFLEIDATIQYVLGDNRLRLTNQDVQVDSPYNTYTRKGLPPGPISNPGLKSLQAAANPAETPLLYYVLTGKDGSHTFTTNLPDFLAAKRKSKQVFGE